MISRKAYYLWRSFRTVTSDPSETRRFQSRLLRQLLSHTYENFEFYRSCWDEHGFSPRDVDSADDLDAAPVIDGGAAREHIQSLPEALDISTGGSLTSSGSSGNGRMKVQYDEQAWDWLEAVYLRNLMLQGYSLRDTQSYYWHDPFDGGIGRRLAVPKQRVPTDASLEEQLHLLEEQAADCIVYFPMVLFTLAKLKQSSDRTYDISPDRVFTQGELLTPAMRSTIRDAFDAPVHDNYGATEFNRIAWECPEREGYHVNSDAVHVEVVDDAGDPVDVGEPGELVGTNLVNTATPIIRYNLGDAVELREKGCSCDTHGPVLKHVKGRASNVVRTADGEPVFPRAIADVLASHTELLMFRLMVDGGDYRLRYVPSEACDDTVLQQVQEDLADLGIRPVEVEAVDDLERTPGGKLPPVEHA